MYIMYAFCTLYMRVLSVLRCSPSPLCNSEPCTRPTGRSVLQHSGLRVREGQLGERHQLAGLHGSVPWHSVQNDEMSQSRRGTDPN